VTAPSPFDASELDGERLRATFEAPKPLTVGLEEEVMLLDPGSLDLRACAAAALERLGGDPRFKPELPAAHLEILTAPCDSVAKAVAELARGRLELERRLDGLARPAAAGVHPFAAPEGELSRGERYDRTAREYGPIARRQLVASLQVHVAVGGADASLAVYNGLRSHLPEIAALAANARFYAGRDTGMASVRPKIAELLPRQGVPPALRSWEHFAEELRWGTGSPDGADPRVWWWELRPHPGFGTLEVRVPDAQTTLADAAAVAATVHSLVAWLAERHAGGEELTAAPAWRIEENRWSAARHGVEGEMTDLDSGARQPTRERLQRLIAGLGEVSDRLGSGPLLARATDLVAENGALRQAALAEAGGVRALTAALADRFLEDASFWAGADQGMRG
jgi:carboxylate-amine ligase